MEYLILFLPFFVLCITYVVACICLHCCALFCGQKTRSQQQRRVFVGSRPRASLQAEPTIYVSPANLPPPPKYEALAPPSYEEVMSVTYPNYQGTQQQPIVYPLTHAVAQTSNVTRNEEPSQSTVVTVTSDDRRTSVTVATT